RLMLRPYSAASGRPGTPAFCRSLPLRFWPCASAFWRSLPGSRLPLHWRLAWRVGATSNTGPDDNAFNGVAAISPDDVWVVGYYSEGMLARTLVMHWD